MTQLKIGSITITVNGYTLNNKLPYFQKSVPHDLRHRLGKATIKIRLHEKNGNIAVQCHRLTQKYASLFQALRDDPSLVPSEIKAAAVGMVELFGMKTGDGLKSYPAPPNTTNYDPHGHIDAFEMFVRDNFDEPNALTEAAFKAFNNELPVLLSEAFSVYLENHQRGNEASFQKDQQQHWDKLIHLLGDKPIETLTREDARKYRDTRIRSGVKPSTVSREINVIRAVINKAIREIPLTMPNHFESLTIQSSNDESDKRIPYSRDEIKALITAALKKNDERRRIIIVLALTGARLAEIVGLRKEDVDLTKNVIHIRAHAGRSLKTDSSQRTIPLLPQALEALRLQILISKTDYLFPAYANSIATKADSASAALNKWAKAIVSDRVLHCFRHSMRDQLRAAQCPESISKEIGGWSTSHDVSIGYGQGYPITVKREWLTKAYAWLDLGT